jgi:hypothetical protein
VQHREPGALRNGRYEQVRYRWRAVFAPVSQQGLDLDRAFLHRRGGTPPASSSTVDDETLRVMTPDRAENPSSSRVMVLMTSHADPAGPLPASVLAANRTNADLSISQLVTARPGA